MEKSIVKKGTCVRMSTMFIVSLLVFLCTLPVVAQEFTIDTILTDSEAQQVRERVFKDYVESASGGRIKVNLLSRRAIVPGGDTDMVEMVNAGSLTMGTPSEGGMSIIFPDIQAVSLPFLVPSWQIGARLLSHDSPFFKKVASEVYTGSGKKMRLIGAHTNSLRNLYTIKPIRTPDDLSSNKVTIRVKEIPLVVDMWNSLGAKAIGLPPADRYMALETGMIQALEGSIASVEQIGSFEILKSVTLTRHQFSGEYMLINEKFFQSLPADLKEIVLQGAQKGCWAASPNREYSDIKALSKLKDQGTNIITLTASEHKQWQDVAVAAARKYLEKTVNPSFINYTIEEVEKIKKDLQADIMEAGK